MELRAAQVDVILNLRLTGTTFKTNSTAIGP